MRILGTCLLVLSILWNQNANAAAAPPIAASQHAVAASNLKSDFTTAPSVCPPAKKMGFVQKLEYRLLLKRIQRLSAQRQDADAPQRNLLSTISLILGIIGVVTLFISSISVVALIAGPAALITGILALGRQHYNTRGSRTKAILGIVMGSVVIFILILAAIVVAAFLGGFMAG